jgi:hypothetical protein
VVPLLKQVSDFMECFHFDPKEVFGQFFTREIRTIFHPQNSQQKMCV